MPADGNVRRLAIVAALALLPPTAPAAASPSTEHAPPWQPYVAIVWPHDGQGNTTAVERSRAVNVSVWPRNQVGCNEALGVGLWVAKDNEPLAPVAAGPSLVQRTVGARTFPSGEFNDVAADLAAAPTGKFRFVTGLAVPTARGSNVWSHAADPRTFLPQPTIPTGYGDPRAAPDTRIQIVWPHDPQGHGAPVDRAPLVNVAVDLFEHGTLRSMSPDFEPFRLDLLVAEGNGAVGSTNKQPQKITYMLGGRMYPRWVFNDVPVVPGRQYHFLAFVYPPRGGPIPYATVWTHAPDARTLLPNPEAPPACVP